MAIEIRQTIVIPTIDGDAVHLHISDALPESKDASFVLVTHVKLPRFQTPAVAQLQREAMKVVQNEITRLLSDLAREIQGAGHFLLDPRPKQ